MRSLGRPEIVGLLGGGGHQLVEQARALGDRSVEFGHAGVVVADAPQLAGIGERLADLGGLA